MANLFTIRRDRAGIRFATCTACKGHGRFEYSDGSGDPERDYTVWCKDCKGEGEWRLTPVDPLEVVAQRRRWARSAFGAKQYGEALQLAVSPVCLPADRAPVALRNAA